MFDNLWNPSLTPKFKKTNNLFHTKTNNMILDHRTKYKNTINTPTTITKLIRPQFNMTIFPFQRPSTKFKRPTTKTKNLSLFNQYSTYPKLTYSMNNSNPLTTIPITLLLQLNNSTNNFLPLKIKNTPHVRIFTPHPTTKTFSTFYQLYF